MGQNSKLAQIKAKKKTKCYQANIYAPNEDNPAFFEDLFYRLSDFNCDDIVIGGDFNLVFDLEKDKKGGFGKT